MLRQILSGVRYFVVGKKCLVITQALQAKFVGAKGAGLGYDGMYYVKSVTSTVKRGEFKQSFSLSRDGLVSITPRVVP